MNGARVWFYISLHRSNVVMNEYFTLQFVMDKDPIVLLHQNPNAIYISLTFYLD